MQSAFLDGGGDVKLVMYEKFGKDGHTLFTRGAGKLQWLMEMDAFLRFHGLPAASRDRVADLMKLLKLEDRQRGFLDRYVAAPTYKVMVQTPDRKHHFTQFGAASLEGARKAALASCAQRYKAPEPCRDRHGERRLARRRRRRPRSALNALWITAILRIRMVHVRRRRRSRVAGCGQKG